MGFWSLAESKVIRTLAATKNGYIGSIAFSPDGKRLAFHADDQSIRLWDVKSRVETARLEGHASGVMTLACLASGRLASGYWDNKIRLWDVKRGAETGRLEA